MKKKIPVIPLADLDIHDKIGTGGFGSVFKARWKRREIDVAVKILKISPSEMTESAIKSLVRECETMLNLHFPFLVQTYGFCVNESETQYGIVMDHYENGSLFDALQKEIKFSWKDKWRLALEIAQAINYLHTCEPAIFHRDIKSANILLTKDFSVRLGDFGLTDFRTKMSSVMSVSASPAMEAAGTVQWMAPELLGFDRRLIKRAKCDVYSYSVLLWEIATGEIPYSDVSLVLIREGVKDGLRLSIPEENDPNGVPHAFSALIKKCWAQKPTERPDFVDIIKEINANIKNMNQMSMSSTPSSTPVSSSSSSSSGSASSSSTDSKFTE